MSEDEIYAFQKDAQLGGTRPTWNTSEHAHKLNQRMHAAYNKMFSDARMAEPGDAVRDIPISAKSKDALAVLDLTHPADKTAIKAQYRALVKKHHPDVNGASPRAEEAFKNITIAYRYLMEHYVSESL
jgi:DnaJ-domain-containing protein 1